MRAIGQGARAGLATALLAAVVPAPPLPAAPHEGPPLRAAPMPPAAVPAPPLGHAPLSLEPGRPVPLPWRGVTVDAVDRLDPLVSALRDHRSAPMVRLVIDPATPVADYAPVITALRPHAYLMVQVADSTALRAMSVATVRQRARALVRAFASQVDLWEVGNELNGSWVGTDPAAINAKVRAAFAEVAASGGRTAITLNHWSGPGCYSRAWEPTLTYARTMPPELRAGVNVVLLSIYETACDPPQHPTAAQVGAMLAALGTIFPRAQLGIGEVGAQGVADGLPADPALAEKRRIAARYYGMQPALAARLGPRFVGGYFWWYYAQDAVPRTRVQSLWPTLDALMQKL